MYDFPKKDKKMTHVCIPQPTKQPTKHKMEAIENFQLNVICERYVDENRHGDSTARVIAPEMMREIVDAFHRQLKTILYIAHHGKLYSRDVSPRAPLYVRWIETDITPKFYENFVMTPIGKNGHLFFDCYQTLPPLVVILYPPTNKIIESGRSNPSRECAKAATLQNGAVFVCGGRIPDGPDEIDPVVSNTAVIYGSAGWSNPIQMSDGLFDHACTLLLDGRVLIVGGFKGVWEPSAQATNRCQMFDPSSGVFAPTSPMRFVRVVHTATTLPDGRVFVCGGFVTNSKGVLVGDAICEIYDPLTNNWEPAAPMIHQRMAHQACIIYDKPPLSDEDPAQYAQVDRPVVLVVGGRSSKDGKTYTTKCEAYDIENNQWYLVPRFDMDVELSRHAMCTVTLGLEL
jgi:hypothetical protein